MPLIRARMRADERGIQLRPARSDQRPFGFVQDGRGDDRSG